MTAVDQALHALGRSKFRLIRPRRSSGSMTLAPIVEAQKSSYFV